MALFYPLVKIRQVMASHLELTVLLMNAQVQVMATAIRTAIGIITKSE